MGKEDERGFGLAPLRREGTPYEWQDRMTRLFEDEATAKRNAHLAQVAFAREQNMSELHPPRSTHAAAPEIVLDELTTRARFDIEQAALAVHPEQGVHAAFWIVDGKITVDVPDTSTLERVNAVEAQYPFETYVNGVMFAEFEPRSHVYAETPQAAATALVDGLKPIVAGKRLFWRIHPSIREDEETGLWYARCRLAAVDVSGDAA